MVNCQQEVKTPKVYRRPSYDTLWTCSHTCPYVPITTLPALDTGGSSLNYDTAHSEVVHQPDSVVTVSVGDNVTLRCSVLKEDHSDPIVWYKQTSGHQPRVVVLVQKFAGKPQFYNEFKSSRFTIERAHEICHLKISNVISSDKAMYYCGWRKFETVFAGGTYLALKGSQNNQHKFNVSIHQHPVTESVYPGVTVTLLCSVLSKHTTADMKMFWFRSDSGKSVPEIMYTRNQSDQCEIDTFRQSCTYNLSKNIVSQKDTGTYYCAVVTCGKILFENGTKTNMGCADRPSLSYNISYVQPMDPVVIVLGELLGVCMALITIQAVLSHKKKRHYFNTVLQDIEKEHPSSQDCDAVLLNYTAIHFKERKIRRGRVKGEVPQDSVYTSVNYSVCY
ncbi:uncharacterized protein LOC127412637 [Myxocyprinus asiaticus]|uniref:uncharacterized protein LOC127412637 n=1 Tax=Myxocyprinus asiaticus TaxID=70543 RepID=UPI0022226708|nr:uncharacterized protein LOC127412637 [Myxocyprinus asiaticus]